MTQTQKANKTTIDSQEVAHFSKLAATWWDDTGPMKPLHDLNPARLLHFKQQICEHFERDMSDINPLDGLKLLDIGCGGGLVCEPMARLGASVTGVDASKENIQTADLHANQMGLEIDYKHETAENMAKEKTKYDVVLALEIIEHVADPVYFIQSALGCLKKDGLLIMSTLNRTSKSFLFAIVGAEYVLRWLPRGTHQWKKFIRPSELARMVEGEKALVTDLTGLKYNPIQRSYHLDDEDLSVNYFLSATR